MRIISVKSWPILEKTKMEDSGTLKMCVAEIFRRRRCHCGHNYGGDAIVGIGTRRKCRDTKNRGRQDE